MKIMKASARTLTIITQPNSLLPIFVRWLPILPLVTGGRWVPAQRLQDLHYQRVHVRRGGGRGQNGPREGGHFFPVEPPPPPPPSPPPRKETGEVPLLTFLQPTHTRRETPSVHPDLPSRSWWCVCCFLLLTTRPLPWCAPRRSSMLVVWIILGRARTG